MIRNRIIKTLSVFLFFAILIQTVACGTILYPERRGQTHGRIDPAVVALDGICLIFFIIPGVVAFAVDFSTGAIYLPRGRKYSSVFQDNNDLEVTEFDIATVDIDSIEKILSKKTGKAVDLDAVKYKTFKITDPEFADKYFIKTTIN